ncbi:unnamed protein product [Clavelina lepadiformis]|uniref:Uncharacterized protein n=1 Tax=Clavelina lepadiformis TaxID=159417 RepID=A0ABP0FXA3_CLALP
MPLAMDEQQQKASTGQVGLRTLPHVKLNYYARAPKPSPFGTVWLPMNASNRVVKDETQDIMHLYYSRHLHVQEPSQGKAGRPTAFRLDTDLTIPAEHVNGADDCVLPPTKTPKQPDSVKAAMWMTDANSLAPFASLGKPTCGYFFSRTTDNKKRLTGIPPTNTVKWRSHNSGK